MYCITFSKPKLEQFLSENPETNLIELRLDLLRLSESQMERYFGLPVEIIATCRPNERMTDRKRFDLLKKSVSLGAAYIDVEIENAPDFIAELVQYAHKNDCKTIVSYHNFECTPDLEKLKAIAAQCIENKADIVKIACMVNDEGDIEKLRALYVYFPSLIVIGMGEKGVVTRLKACEWGAPFTFVAAYSDEATASGQMSYDQIK